jgi:hypothetical protein
VIWRAPLPSRFTTYRWFQPSRSLEKRNWRPPFTQWKSSSTSTQAGSVSVKTVRLAPVRASASITSRRFWCRLRRWITISLGDSAHSIRARYTSGSLPVSTQRGAPPATSTTPIFAMALGEPALG